MAYLALYRKYRPQTFDDIMGQHHVTRTLQNAIRQDRVAHAYLFCGPRGTAKTTAARVLAKAMNCEHGPTPDPCDRCDACERIREGRSLDVVEIDAASNRGIDDIKLLREQVGRASAQERVKFYIIDEVHQLSADAFQALLKTLEEPPPNVLFVLATTETHRVPKTIVSRCQRFDFRRGTMRDLTDRLRYVADQESMQADPEALTAIARAAAGGWRDALSLLEQVSAYHPERIDLPSVSAVLGSVEGSALQRIVGAIASGDRAVLFREIEEQVGEGKEPRQLLSSIGAYLRDLLWLRSGAGDLPSGELSDAAQDQSKSMSTAAMMRGLEAINQAESQMRWVSDHRLLLELTLLRAADGRDGGGGGDRPAAAPVEREPASSEKRAAVQRVEKPAVVARAAPASPNLSAGSGPVEPEPAASKQTDPAVPNLPDTRAAAKPEPGPEDFAESEESIEGGVDEIWRKVLSQVKPNLRGLLKDGVPRGLSGKLFRVAFVYKAHADLLEKKENREQIEKALKTLTGVDLRVKGELLPESPPRQRDSSGNGNAPDRTGDYLSGDAEFAEFFSAEKIVEGDA